MKHLYFSLLAFLFLCNSNAQTYHWMNQLGGAGSESARLSIDTRGNVYTISDIPSDASFKPRSPKEYKLIKTTSSATKNLIITKVDAVGNLLWVRQVEDIITTSTITTDQHNNVLVAGVYTNTKDFDPGVGVFNLTAKHAGDIFILKLDENGNFIWAGSIGGKNGDDPYSLTTDKNDNLALVCIFNDTIDVDMSTTGVHNLIATTPLESAVLKLSPTGKFLWAHHLKDINAAELCFDTSGNLYTTGYFLGTKDFDFGPGVFNMTTTGAAISGDCYALKEDTAGKFLWAKSFGEFVNKDAPTAIAVDKSDNVIIAGNCGGGNSDFDPGPGVVNLVGNTDFILKLSSSGNYIWAKGINGGSVPFEFTGLGVDDSNFVYAAGFFNTTVDFDPSISTSYLSPLATADGFFMKMDLNGSFVWANQIRSTSSSYINSLSIQGNGNIYLGGNFSLITDFDPGIGKKTDSSVGNRDAFTLKLSRCLLNNSISLNECKYYDYAGHRFDSSELIDVLFVTAAGCDSVVTVDMMVKTVNDTISAAGSVITAKSTTATSYQWVNCPSYSAIAGATSASYTATVTGNYALIVTENGCTDTSACVSVVGLSIQEAQQSEAISISPNPSKGMFNLSLPSEIKGQLEIKSIDGKLLYSEWISSTKLTIDLSNYSSGLYILNVTDNKGKKIIEKLMKY